MKAKEKRYQHTITVTVETQMPKTGDFAEQVRCMLGPWCIAAKVVKLNTVVEEKKAG